MLRCALFALLALTATASKRFTWAGCDTNFDNPENWAGVVPLVSDIADESVVPPQVVYYGPTEETEDTYTPVNSLLRATESTYALNTLVLPSTGDFTLGSNDVRIVFFEEEETDGVTEFTGAQTDRDECRFDCHKNWVLHKGLPSEVLPALPPCALDTAVFDDTSSYHIQAHGVLEMTGIIWHGQTIVTEQGLPDYAMSPGGADLLRLVFENPTVGCSAQGLTDKDGNCFCHTSCPADGTTFREQDAELRAKAKEFANLPAQKQLVEDYTATFTMAFDVDAIALAENVANFSAGLDCMMNDAANPMEEIVAGTVRDMLPKFKLSNAPSITRSAYLTVAGSVTGPTYLFLDPVTRTYLPEWRDNSYNQIFLAQPNTSQADRLALVVFKAIQEQAQTCLKAEEAPTRAALAAGCDLVANGLCSAMDQLSAAAGGDDFVIVEELLLLYSNHVDDEPEAPFVINATVYAEENNFVETPELTAAIVALNAADWTTLEDPAVVDYLDHVTNPFDWFQPNYEMHSVSYTLAFGTALPQSDVDRLFDELNFNTYRDTLMATFDGMLPIMNLLELKVTQERLSNIHAELLEKGNDKQRRAYSGGGQAIDVVRADLVFEGIFRFSELQEEGCQAMDCLPAFAEIVADDRRRSNEADPLSPPPAYAMARLVADDATSAYTVAVAQCCNLETGPDNACIAESLVEEVNEKRSDGASSSEVDAFISSEATKRAQACGYPLSESQLDDLINEAGNAAASGAPKKEANSLPLVAGAAAAGVLVVAVAVYMLVFRKKSGPRETMLAPGKDAAHRSVVSFENPTYANPEQDVQYGGVLDAGDDDEGLYDQPAVTNKSNPMYASNEDLAMATQDAEYANGDAAIWDDDGAEEGGYLAVDAADEEDDFDGEEDDDDFDAEEEYAPEAGADDLYEEMDTVETAPAEPAFEEEATMLAPEEQVEEEAADLDDEQADFDDESEEDEDMQEDAGGYLDVEGEDSDEEQAVPEGYVDVDAPANMDDDDDYEEDDDDLYGDNAADVGFEE